MMCSRRYDILDLLLMKMFVAYHVLSKLLAYFHVYSGKRRSMAHIVIEKVDFVSLIMEIKLFHSVFTSKNLLVFVSHNSVFCPAKCSENHSYFSENCFCLAKLGMKPQLCFGEIKNALSLCVAKLGIKVKPQSFFTKNKCGVSSQQAKFLKVGFCCVGFSLLSTPRDKYSLC